MNKIISKAEKLKELNFRLKISIKNEDFLQSDKINKEIDELNKSSVPDLPKKDFDFNEIAKRSLNRAISGGLSGSTAMALQVLTLMWMRTIMNYQYKYGTTTKEAFLKLYSEGGVRRFYRGIGPALIQGPLSRFGDTASNTGVLTLLNEHPKTQNIPVFLKTMCASTMAALFRIFLMPVDTIKTSLQVDGKDGFKNLMTKARNNGATVFYHGSIASSAATFVGHFPWFFTFNLLDSKLPKKDLTSLQKLARNAFMGFTSSVVSDTISNSIRVVKTYRQTSSVNISYVDTVRTIVKADGYMGLFGRGLKTRIITNGIQGLMFSVLWKYFENYFK